MNYINFPFFILALAGSAHPSIDRYITELPSHQQHVWDYSMVADQPYSPAAPVHPSSYIYQIDDPSANYIYSSDYFTKKDTSPSMKRSSSSTWTPTRGPNARFGYIGIATPMPALVRLRVTRMLMHLPPPAAVIIRRYYAARAPLWYPSNYDYAGNVYTTPYEFSGGIASTFVPTFVRPNVLYSTYSTYSKPVYVVNNAFNGFIPNIYENPKQYVGYYTLSQQPVGHHYDATKTLNYPNTQSEAVNKKKPPVKVQRKPPIETNLTKITIDPITEARFAAETIELKKAAYEPISSDNSETSLVIHKQRPNYHNTYGVVYHKLNDVEQSFSPRWSVASWGNNMAFPSQIRTCRGIKTLSGSPNVECNFDRARAAVLREIICRRNGKCYRY